MAATANTTADRPGRRPVARPGNGPGRGPLGNAGIVALIVLMTLAGVLLLWALWGMWPTEVTPRGGQGDPSPNPKANILWWDVESIDYDIRLGVIVALAGALGGTLHALRSLIYFVGNRRFIRSWVPFYILRPLLGAVLATVFYIVVRAGLFNPSTEADEVVNPYGVAAIAVLVGLFSEQALQKLEELFQVLFTQPPQQADALSTRTPTVETGPAKNVTTTGATLTGDVTAGSCDVEWFFEWGTTEAYGETTAAQTAKATEEVSAEADIVAAAGQTIHYRLVADADSILIRGNDREITLKT